MCSVLRLTARRKKDEVAVAKEIAKKVNEDFDNKKLPLMLAMINAIVEDKKLELNWEAFR